MSIFPSLTNLSMAAKARYGLTPLAIFSRQPQHLFNYFKQIFAQVTNPAIDPIREGLVMSLTNYIGSLNSNILSESPDHCRLIKFLDPILINTDLGKIKDLKDEMFTHTTIPMLFPANRGIEGFRKAFDRMLKAAEDAVDNKKNFIILSDRALSSEMAPFPSLLAVAAVHHHLIQKKKRMQVGIIVETGEVREVNHFALLLGFGATPAAMVPTPPSETSFTEIPALGLVTFKSYIS